MPASQTPSAAAGSSASNTVLVVDSGVGGLSILLAIARKAPQLNFHYVSDNAAFPYGDKPESFLIERVARLVEQTLNEQEADIIVIACNTASTVVLPKLREHFSLPIVGVVPAIKTASQRTNSKVFGLLATPGTVNRDYTRQLMNEHAADCAIVSVGSSELVQLAENYLYSGRIEVNKVADILNQFERDPLHNKIDTLVLGCTHFPLIAEHIQQLRPHWHLVDSGDAIARRVCNLLGIAEAVNVKPVNSANNDTANRQIHFTDLSRESKALEAFLEHNGFARPQELSLHDVSRINNQ